MKTRRACGSVGALLLGAMQAACGSSESGTAGSGGAPPSGATAAGHGGSGGSSSSGTTAGTGGNVFAGTGTGTGTGGGQGQMFDVQPSALQTISVKVGQTMPTVAYKATQNGQPVSVAWSLDRGDI